MTSATYQNPHASQEPWDTLLKGGTAFLPGGLTPVDIAIRHGKIVAIGASLSTDQAQEVVDVTGLAVLPGVIDSQVHFREPGLEHKEDLESGTRGAVLGGVTGILEMPNTKPQTLDAAAINAKLDLAKNRAWCNYGFFMGAAASNVEHLADLEQVPGCCGVKIFMGSSTGGLLVEDDSTLRQALSHGYRRVAVHCEDEPRLRERAHLSKEATSVHSHPQWRDEEVAFKATRRIVNLALETNRAIHTLHITTAQEIEFLGQFKDRITVEVTPQHLTLWSPDCYDRLGTYAQMNPPIREKYHQDALWQGIADGTVDVIGSDHAPHTREEKEKGYPATPSGMPGVQTLLPLMLNHVHQGRLTLDRLVDLVCTGPARLYHMMGKGRIAKGYDADFTVVDLNHTETITHQWMATKSGWTPFDGMAVTGWPIMTIIGGHMAMRDGEVQGSPVGEPIRYRDQIPTHRYQRQAVPASG